jgi:hypothetical protein
VAVPFAAHDRTAPRPARERPGARRFGEEIDIPRSSGLGEARTTEVDAHEPAKS